MLFTRTFWADAGERAVKTFAQALLAFWGSDAFNVVDADWGEALAIGAGAAVLSVLSSVASSGVAARGTASLTRPPDVDPADV